MNRERCRGQSGRSRARVAKAASISPIVAALNIWICSPIVIAASCTSRIVGSAVAVLVGLTSTARRAALGTNSFRSRSRRQAVVLAVQPVVLDHHVLALEVAGFVEGFTKCSAKVRGALG